MTCKGFVTGNCYVDLDSFFRTMTWTGTWLDCKMTRLLSEDVVREWLVARSLVTWLHPWLWLYGTKIGRGDKLPVMRCPMDIMLSCNCFRMCSRLKFEESKYIQWWIIVISSCNRNRQLRDFASIVIVIALFKTLGILIAIDCSDTVISPWLSGCQC